jgi:hypothetical protein
MATHLTLAHRELFRRKPDESFLTLEALHEHCLKEKEASLDRWQLPGRLSAKALGERLVVALGDDGAFSLTDWSFGQLCRAGGLSKDTLNRLSADTAARALRETLPLVRRPTQALSTGTIVRALHGTGFVRLWNADLLSAVREYATDFTPPPCAAQGGTGLYCGEQDLFAFLIDPNGFCEVEGEAFAPGFFVWNSEVGRRTLGLQTFWFQAVCQNHIVWDAVEVTDFSWKHTSKIHEALDELRRALDGLAKKRDERRDGFVKVVRRAMQERLGDSAEEVLKRLTEAGIPLTQGRAACELAHTTGKRFTVFSLVDALTRLAQGLPNAGERTEADLRAARLLSFSGAGGALPAAA